jgi:hypothetical protein
MPRLIGGGGDVQMNAWLVLLSATLLFGSDLSHMSQNRVH